jgi:hypothetical protein
VGASSLEELVFDQGQRALDRQQQSVADRRTRTGAVAGLIGALLVAPAVRAKPSWTCTIASAACLAAGVLFAALVPSLPWKVRFVVNPNVLLEAVWADRDDIGVVHHSAAAFLWKVRERNRRRVNWTHALFALGVVVLAFAAGFGVLARS